MGKTEVFGFIILGMAIGIGVWVQLVLIERRLSEVVERLSRLLANFRRPLPPLRLDTSAPETPAAGGPRDDSRFI